MRLHDHKVPYLDYQAIAKFAMAWRGLVKTRGHHFNICDFIENILTPKFIRKGRLKIVLHEGDKVKDAYVQYDPLTLNVNRKVWAHAREGQAYARYILAHEIGHIILHDHRAIAFSYDSDQQLSFVENEKSAEWQAHTFARCFLIPESVARRFPDIDTIAGLCVVPDSVAKLRLEDPASLIAVHQYEGDMCSGCGYFTLVRIGIEVECETCGRPHFCS